MAALGRFLSFVLGVLLILPLTCPVCFAEEDRPVLTIGDVNDRSSKHVDGDEQLGLWRYLEDRLGVEIKYVHLTEDAYADGLASGNLPDIVSTDNNLASILENGVALDVEPYLEEYVPNFLRGDAKLTYSVYKQLLNKGEGFYFFPARIGYNNVGFSVGSAYRGYVVRWDYYKELGYPPVNNEDDYLNVLKRMHERHPFTEEGYPTYLYGTENPEGYETAFRSELSLNYWSAYKYQNSILRTRYTTAIRTPRVPCGGRPWLGSTGSIGQERRTDPLTWRSSPRPRNSSVPNAGAVSTSGFPV